MGLNWLKIGSNDWCAHLWKPSGCTVLQCHLKIAWQFERVLSYQIVQRWPLESAVTKNCIMEDKETLTNLSEEYAWKKQKQGLVFIQFIFFVKLKTFCSFYSTGQQELDQRVKTRSMITTEGW